jgi:hypothetical protein
LKEQLIAPKKIYCIDQGLANTMSFRFSGDRGKLMENLVAVELMRRSSYWYNNWEVYYWKDHQQNEVDFIIKEGLKVKEIIQVTCINEKDELNRREINALLKSSKDLKCKNLKVITWDFEGEEIVKEKRIEFMPLWKFLLF